jgi:hypothetical protein
VSTNEFNPRDFVIIVESNNETIFIPFYIENDAVVADYAAIPELGLNITGVPPTGLFRDSKPFSEMEFAIRMLGLPPEILQRFFLDDPHT